MVGEYRPRSQIWIGYDALQRTLLEKEKITAISIAG